MSIEAAPPKRLIRYLDFNPGTVPLSVVGPIHSENKCELFCHSVKNLGGKRGPLPPEVKPLQLVSKILSG